MDISLTGEGTYPYFFGGLSVWCDQLVRGMPDYRFDVLTLVSSGSERVAWDLPSNVASVRPLALWGPTRPTSSRRKMSEGLRIELCRFVSVLLAPPDESQDRFGEILRTIYEIAKTEDLTASLSGEEAVWILSEFLREHEAAAGTHHAPTLQDAVHAMQLLEHGLRPLSHRPPRGDVVHCVTNGLGVLPGLASKWDHGTPLLVTEHGLYLREQYLHHRNPPFRWPVKSLYLSFIRRLCALGYTEATAICPGNAYNQRWQERLGADRARVRTVYNGVDPSEFPEVASEPDRPTISWAGRIDPVKDLDTLLRAFALVLKKVPDAQLRIFGAPQAGQEAYGQHCKDLAVELDINESVRFEGRVQDIREAYVAGHVVALSSIAEGIPYTVIEAMTCGRPCVGTDVGGVAEALGGTGIVVTPRNVPEFAAACVALLEDHDRRHRLGTAARVRALEFFTVDRGITAYDEVYSLLAAGRALPADPVVIRTDAVQSRAPRTSGVDDDPLYDAPFDETVTQVPVHLQDPDEVPSLHVEVTA
jgi:glycosyltransferase involved in cell wall biosynthesis